MFYATHQSNIFSDFHFILVHSFSLSLFEHMERNDFLFVENKGVLNKDFSTGEQRFSAKEGLRPPNKGFE